MYINIVKKSSALYIKIRCFVYGKRSDVQRQQQVLNSRRTAEESRTSGTSAQFGNCSAEEHRIFCWHM